MRLDLMVGMVGWWMDLPRARLQLCVNPLVRWAERTSEGGQLLLKDEARGRPWVQAENLHFARQTSETSKLTSVRAALRHQTCAGTKTVRSVLVLVEVAKWRSAVSHLGAFLSSAGNLPVSFEGETARRR